MQTSLAIKTFGIGKLNHAAYGAFMLAFEKLIAKGTVAKLGLAGTDFDAFKAKLQQFLDLNQELGQQQETKELLELDKERDQLLTYLFAKVALEASSPESTLKQAAEVLLPLRKQYLGLQTKANREETFLIEGLLVDSKKSEFAAAFQAVGLKKTLERLEAVNKSYQEKTMARSEANLAQKTVSAKTLRMEMDAFYQASTKKIDAVQLIAPVAETEAFINSLNQLIAETQEAWKLRKSQQDRWTEEGEREDEANEKEDTTEEATA